MQVNTIWQGKRNFVSECPSGFEVKMDATGNYGGNGQGLTPMELILAGVAGCIGIDVTMLLGKDLEKITFSQRDMFRIGGTLPTRYRNFLENHFIVETK